jgi:hypothetical protein
LVYASFYTSFGQFGQVVGDFVILETTLRSYDKSLVVLEVDLVILEVVFELLDVNLEL